MKSVLVRIKQYLPDSTIAEQGVLNYILSNPDKAVQHNIHQLSEYSYSSASTIVRLCRNWASGIQRLAKFPVERTGRTKAGQAAAVSTYGSP